MTGIVIRPIEDTDFGAWLPLWDGNNNGQRNQGVTTSTWDRLTTANSGVYGLGAFKGSEMVGLLHYITHPVTGHIEPACYMQDLYVSDNHRRTGIASQLIKELAKVGQYKNWTRIYWFAESTDEAAQALYQKIGNKLDFTLHVM